MTLTAIEAETSPARIVLRTTASPVYTSYSPMPELFVIDLTGASKASSLAIPANLPPSVASVSVEDVTEMGSRLTRVSVHLTQSATIDASAEGNNVIINLPAVAAAAVAKTAPVSASAPVVPQHIEPVPTAEVKAEPQPEPVKSEP